MTFPPVAQSNEPTNTTDWNIANQFAPNYEVIYKPNPPDIERDMPDVNRLGSGGGHSIRATGTISEEALRQYLESEKSPLAPFAGQLLQSPYWSTIIAICTIEEYNCSVNPHGTNNLWGLMANGHLIAYPSLDSGILAIETFLNKAENNGRTTIESFRGWYCYDAATADHICWNWESTVITTKAQLDSL